MALRLRVAAPVQPTPAGVHRMATHYLVVVALHRVAVVVRHPGAATRLVAVTHPAAAGLQAQEALWVLAVVIRRNEQGDDFRLVAP